MLKSGILNPQINSLLSRVRHTNTLVIADRGFPYWPAIEVVDLSLVDDIPRVKDVLQAVLQNFSVGRFFMAEEFCKHNAPSVVDEFVRTMHPAELIYEPHNAFKSRIPHATGLIRTGDTLPYANVILESA
jgi:D-ribose pyranase